MKSEEIKVKSNGQGMEDALVLTENTARNAGIDGKNLLRMRLLAEELIGMMRGITDSVEALYTVEITGEKKFALHLKSDVNMKREMYDQLIAVSSSGKNSATKGFMGKIREMITVALLPKESGISFMSGFSMGLMSTAGAAAPNAQMIAAESFEWSLSQYRTSVERGLAAGGSDSGEAKNAWDELEKSIVASIADEVKVSVVGSSAEIVIFKAF